jgi:hypothetical protein
MGLQRNFPVHSRESNSNYKAHSRQILMHEIALLKIQLINLFLIKNIHKIKYYFRLNTCTSGSTIVEKSIFKSDCSKLSGPYRRMVSMTVEDA